jgi:hypothetical protein
MGHLCHRQAYYQLSYNGEHDGMCFNKAYQLMVKKLQNETCITKKLLEFDT